MLDMSAMNMLNNEKKTHTSEINLIARTCARLSAQVRYPKHHIKYVRCPRQRHLVKNTTIAGVTVSEERSK